MENEGEQEETKPRTLLYICHWSLFWGRPMTPVTYAKDPEVNGKDIKDWLSIWIRPEMILSLVRKTDVSSLVEYVSSNSGCWKEGLWCPKALFPLVCGSLNSFLQSSFARLSVLSPSQNTAKCSLLVLLLTSNLRTETVFQNDLGESWGVGHCLPITPGPSTVLSCI